MAVRHALQIYASVLMSASPRKSPRLTVVSSAAAATTTTQRRKTTAAVAAVSNCDSNSETVVSSGSEKPSSLSSRQQSTGADSTSNPNIATHTGEKQSSSAASATRRLRNVALESLPMAGGAAESTNDSATDVTSPLKKYSFRGRNFLQQTDRPPPRRPVPRKPLVAPPPLITLDDNVWDVSIDTARSVIQSSVVGSSSVINSGSVSKNPTSVINSTTRKLVPPKSDSPPPPPLISLDDSDLLISANDIFADTHMMSSGNKRLSGNKSGDNMEAERNISQWGFSNAPSKSSLRGIGRGMCSRTATHSPGRRRQWEEEEVDPYAPAARVSPSKRRSPPPLINLDDESNDNQQVVAVGSAWTVESISADVGAIHVEEEKMKLLRRRDRTKTTTTSDQQRATKERTEKEIASVETDVLMWENTMRNQKHDTKGDQFARDEPLSSSFAFDLRHEPQLSTSYMLEKSSVVSTYSAEGGEFERRLQQWDANVRYEQSRNFDHNSSTDGGGGGVSQKTHVELPPRKWRDTRLGEAVSDDIRRGATDGGGGSGGLPSFTFTVASYNVLAQSLLELNRYLYSGSDPTALEWSYRSPRLLQQLADMNADILCLQEVQVDHYASVYVPFLERLGYVGDYKKRTGDKDDGLAIFYRRDRFDLIDVSRLEYKHFGTFCDRDNVALIVVLRPKGDEAAAAVVGASADDRDSPPSLVVATTHILYNTRRHDIKLAQTQMLFAELDRLAYRGTDRHGQPKYHPTIVTGDLNLEPYSPVYRFITEGNLFIRGMSNKWMTPSYEGRMIGDTLLPAQCAITNASQYVDVARRRVAESAESTAASMTDGRNEKDRHSAAVAASGGELIDNDNKVSVPMELSDDEEKQKVSKQSATSAIDPYSSIPLPPSTKISRESSRIDSIPLPEDTLNSIPLPDRGTTVDSIPLPDNDKWVTSKKKRQPPAVESASSSPSKQLQSFNKFVSLFAATSSAKSSAEPPQTGEESVPEQSFSFNQFVNKLKSSTSSEKSDRTEHLSHETVAPPPPTPPPHQTSRQESVSSGSRTRSDSSTSSRPLPEQSIDNHSRESSANGDFYRGQSGTVSHRLNLRSVYSHRSFGNGGGRFPPPGNTEVTTNHDGYWTTVDYLLYSTVFSRRHERNVEGRLRLLSRLSLPTADDCNAAGGFPSLSHPSDHHYLMARFALYADNDRGPSRPAPATRNHHHSHSTQHGSGTRSDTHRDRPREHSSWHRRDDDNR